MPFTTKILIVGAGPTGLGAASRLWQLGHKDWLLVESNASAGGLASTDVTNENFLFDYGGHVKFSHYQYFDDLLEAAMGGSGDDVWNTHKRISHVRIKNRLVSYPFQNNLSQLDQEDALVCVEGLVRAQTASAVVREPPRTFDEWIVRTMGTGIADMFMRPYNFKVWAYPTTSMQAKWMGERVATVDAVRAIRNLVQHKVEDSWGPNAVFRFPVHGGTGAMWTSVAKMLPRQNIMYNARVDSVRCDEKKVVLENGTVITYEKMLTTCPLDLTMRQVGMEHLSEGLQYSSSHIIGIGLRGVEPPGETQWMYFPEGDCPFYRATMFSKYSKYNVPPDSQLLPTLCLANQTPGAGESKPGPYWSLMFEVSESPLKPVATELCDLNGRTVPKVVLDTLQGAINTKLCKETDEVVSIYYRKFDRGYPTPSLDRDQAVERSLAFLKEKSIWSRGRFGSWKYEIANQDHSCMLGVEAVDNMLFGSRELTLNYPDLVNAPGNQETDKRFARPAFK